MKLCMPKPFVILVILHIFAYGGIPEEYLNAVCLSAQVLPNQSICWGELQAPHHHAVAATGGVCVQQSVLTGRLCAQAQGGWLCSQLHCDLPAAHSTPAPYSAAGASAPGDGAAAAQRSAARAASGSGASARGAAGGAAWFAGGGNCLLARHGALLVEYDAAMRAPIGVVFMGIGVRTASQPSTTAMPHSCPQPPGLGNR